jgi:hypothetical protein
MRYPQGFFTAPFIPNDEQKLKFYDFTSFSHFFDHLRPGRQEKLRRKLVRFQHTRKTYFLRQRFLMHEMYPFKDGYILAGELYYPQFEGENAGNRVFSGYGFSQVIVAAFNEHGNLLWENSFPLKNVEQFELHQVTAAGVDGSRLIICYKDEELIRYKIISGNENSSNELILNIAPIIPNEKIESSNLTGIKAWHHNQFLAFGEQKISSNAGTRSVFFLNKITF